MQSSDSVHARVSLPSIRWRLGAFLIVTRVKNFNKILTHTALKGSHIFIPVSVRNVIIWCLDQKNSVIAQTVRDLYPLIYYLDRYYHSIQFLKYCNLYKLVNMQILEVSREIFVNPKSQCFYSFFVGTQWHFELDHISPGYDWNDVVCSPLVTVVLVTSSAMGAMGSSSIHNSEKHRHDPATTQLLQPPPQSLAMNGMESGLLGQLRLVWSFQCLDSQCIFVHLHPGGNLL